MYFKVGLLTTIGLAAKNAILIVEFARELEAQRRTAVASGAGAGAQNAIGIGVLGGMLAARLLGIFMVPSFHVLIRRLTPKKAVPAAVPTH